MAALRFGTKFPHFSKHSDAFPIGIQFHQSAQRRFHRIGISVVTVVDKLHAMNFLDLQTRLGERSGDQAGSAILEGKTKDATDCDCEQRVLNHVQTGHRQLRTAAMGALQYRKIRSGTALSNFAGEDRSCSCAG